jgi:transposase-like protein
MKQTTSICEGLTEVRKQCKHCKIEKPITEYHQYCDDTFYDTCMICNIGYKKQPTKSAEPYKLQKLHHAVGERHCRTCKEVKDLSEFYYCEKNSRYSADCKKCHSIVSRTNFDRCYYPIISTISKSVVPSIKIIALSNKRERVFELYRTTLMTLCSIANETGIGYRTLLSWKKQGVFNSMERPNINTVNFRVTKDKRDRVFELYKNNEISLSEVAKETGVGDTTITRWKKRGIFDKIERPKIKHSMKILNNKKDRAFELYKNTEMTLSAIAKDIGICQKTILKWNKHGIFDSMERPNNAPNLVKVSIPADKRERIFELYRTTTMTLHAIAKETNIDASTLSRWNTQGVFNAITRPTNIDPYKNIDQDKLKRVLELYRTTTIPLREIAKMSDISHVTVWRWQKRGVFNDIARSNEKNDHEQIQIA